MNMHEALYRYFSYKEFRPGQEDIINSLLKGRNIIAVMPTGGGKSLCFQLPALLLEGSALVISPLIALMKDQVDSLARNGISSTFINSSLSNEELDERIEKAVRGEYKLIYIAPERIKSPRFLDALRSIKVSFLAVDEAHCISEWGHDFRPAYLNIKELLPHVNNKPVIALTATATPEAIKDISQILQLRDPDMHVKGFDRPNLSYKTELTDQKLKRTIEEIQKIKDGSVIIYAGSRKRVEAFVTGLQKQKIPAIRYHGGLEDAERKTAQDLFISGKKKIIAATNAFGMGIDKADVRLIIHVDYTQTLEAYYQEAGRAGRDGQPSKCLLLHNHGDRSLQEFFISNNFPERKTIEQVYAYLTNNIGEFSSYKAAAAMGLTSFAIESVLDLLEREKIIEKNYNPKSAAVKFTASKARIREYFNNLKEENKAVMEALLRTVSYEAMDKYVQINVDRFARTHNLSSEMILNVIRNFQFGGVLDYRPPAAAGDITLLKNSKTLDPGDIDYQKLEERKALSYHKLDKVIEYANTENCKRNFILEYFNETGIKDKCGKCSSCINRKPAHDLGDKVFQRLISGAIELDGRFGKRFLFDYLKGKSNERTQNYKLHKGKFFASLATSTLQLIEEEYNFALAHKYIEESKDKYKLVSVTDKEIRGLKSLPEPVYFLKTKKEEKADPELMLRLQNMRACLKGYKGGLEDYLLRRIAIEKPQTANELEAIKGIPLYAQKAYRDKIIETIEKFERGDFEEDIQEEAHDISEHELDLEKICEMHNANKAEAAKIIEDMIKAGKQLTRKNFISDIDYTVVKTFIRKAPFCTLREIREKSSSNLDYPNLRIAKAFALAELNDKTEADFTLSFFDDVRWK